MAISADAQEGRINVGRKPRKPVKPVAPTKPAVPSSNEWGNDAAIMNAILPEYQTLQDYGAISPTGEVNPNAGVNINKFIETGLAARNFLATPTTTKAATGTGRSPVVDVLRAMVTGLGKGNESDIASTYGNLINSAQSQGAERQAMIDRYYGGAEGAAQQRLNDTLTRLQTLIGGARTELGTQTAEGTQRIDESTQRALAALGAQANPYAGLQALGVPVSESPLMGNLQALGQNTQGLSALRDMFAAESAQGRNSAQNMINVLSAAQQAAQQGRMTDVELARGAAQQDLDAAQRAAAQMLTNQQLQGEQAAQQTYTGEIGNLQQAALQARLSGQTELANVLSQLSQSQLQATLGERANQTSRRDQIIAALLQAAQSGNDVSSLLPFLGGA